MTSVHQPDFIGQVLFSGCAGVSRRGRFSGRSRIPSAAYPVLSAILATVSGTDVTITWTTDIASDSVVEYGLTSAYGTAVGIRFEDIGAAAYVTSHSISIFGLADGSYHYRVSSKSPSGGITNSADQTFYIGAKAVIIAGAFPYYANMNGTRQSVVGATYLNETVT